MRRYLTLLPFGVFEGLFLLLPVGAIVVRSVLGEGGLTLSHYGAILRPLYVKSLFNSIAISVLTTALGIAIGLPAALGLVMGVAPKRQSSFLALAATAANFAGVPLAVAFTVLFGLRGAVTRLILHEGLSLFPGFNLYSVGGLTLLYAYFQIPLFVVLMIPALRSFRKEWQEAALTLGGNVRFFWKKVGIPVLLPAIIGNGIFLFANSFGAYATAFALVGAKFRLFSIQISLAVAGNVGYDPEVASAMATVMLGGLLLLFFFYIRLQRRFALWVGR